MSAKEAPAAWEAETPNQGCESGSRSESRAAPTGQGFTVPLPAPHVPWLSSRLGKRLELWVKEREERRAQAQKGLGWIAVELRPRTWTGISGSGFRRLCWELGRTPFGPLPFAVLCIFFLLEVPLFTPQFLSLIHI